MPDCNPLRPGLELLPASNPCHSLRLPRDIMRQFYIPSRFSAFDTLPSKCFPVYTVVRYCNTVHVCSRLPPSANVLTVGLSGVLSFFISQM